MNNKKNQSDLLRRLISAEFIRAHPDPETVSGVDLIALKAILRGETRPDFPVDRKVALDLLSRSEISPDAAEILAAAMTEANAPLVLCADAAYLLRRMPGDTAEALLIPALKHDDDRLRRAIVRSLAHVGGPAAQKALSKLPATPELEVARLLIALRNGTHKGGLSDALDAGFSEVTSSPFPEDEAQRIIDRLGGAAANVPLGPKRAVSVECRNARHAVLLAKNVDFEKPGIIGAVARFGKDADETELRYLVLFAPARERAEIALVTPSGRVDYAGHGTTVGSGMSFELRDFGVTSAPLTASAKVTAKSLNVTLEIVDSNDRAAGRARTPQAILTVHGNRRR